MSRILATFLVILVFKNRDSWECNYLEESRALSIKTISYFGYSRVQISRAIRFCWGNINYTKYLRKNWCIL